MHASGAGTYRKKGSASGAGVEEKTAKASPRLEESWHRWTVAWLEPGTGAREPAPRSSKGKGEKMTLADHTPRPGGATAGTGLAPSVSFAAFGAVEKGVQVTPHPGPARAGRRARDGKVV